MIRNYIRTAWRNLRRGKSFSLVNIAGLALGIAVFLFIMEYVAFEWSANRFNKNYDRLYRFNVSLKNGTTSAQVAPAIGPVLRTQFPEVENMVRTTDGIAAGVISYTGTSDVTTKLIREENIQYVDGSFFNVFSFPLIAGTRSLYEPQTLALSDDISRKLFGQDEAIGKTVTVSNQFGNTLYTVRAVYRLPETSDIKAQVLLSFQTLESAANRDGNDWADPAGFDNSFTGTYVLLKPNADPAKLTAKITTYFHKTNPSSEDQRTYLQPLSEMHLAPSFSYPYQTFGNLTIVLVFLCVSILILVIAWVNYINLSTAQSLNKAKEIGVRKALGAARIQLVLQYMTETLLYTVAATAIALFLVFAFQDLFNQFVQNNLSLRVLANGSFLSAAGLLIIGGSLLSGFYVAFVLTSFKPANIIRGALRTATRGVSMRHGLVVFQFTVSVIFIIAVFILYKQLQYMQTENLGMTLNQLLVVQGPTVTTGGQAMKNRTFKNELGRLAFVEKYAASNNVPGQGYNFFADGIGQSGASEEDRKKTYGMLICDENYFDTWGIQFIQGRPFNTSEAERSWNTFRGIIINEKAASQLGLNVKENIIGKKINWGVPYEIIGVIKDYHHLSLRQQIQPAIYLPSVSYGYFTIRLSGKELPEKISAIKKLYNTTFPGNAFEYFFADKKYDQQYFQDQKLGKVFVASAAVAIAISCMGLFGLALYAARQRTKEIGIRKVLGAGVATITLLLSKDFLKLVAVAILIASPLAWWMMNRWLQDFAYRTTINWTIFLGAGLTAVIIAWSTVCFHTLKAATANPVESLRSE